MPIPQELFPKTEISIRGSKLKFSSYEKLSAFWELERNGFRNILEGSRANRLHAPAQFLAQVMQRAANVDAQFGEVRGAFQRYPAAMDDKQKAELQTRLAALAGALVSAVQHVFADDKYSFPLSTEPEGKFLLGLAKANRDEAAFAFLYLRAVDYEDEAHVAKSGTLKAQLYQANITGLRGDAEAAAIADITKKWRAEAAKLTEEAEANNRSAREINARQIAEIEALAAAEAERSAEYKVFLANREKEHSKQLAAAATELTKIAETYDQHMKLLAPVDYWSKKKTRHLGEARTLRWWTIGVGSLSFAMLGAYVWFNFHEGAAGVVPWREIIGFFVLSSLVFWVVKILVRLLLSAIHLAEDAAEREVMAMTYMALVRGDGTKTKYLDPDDRALVLGPLFRPSATGVIDDGAPPHVSEIITKVGR